MKQLLVFTLLTFSTGLMAQLNTTLRSQLDYNVPVNDIWGYVAPDGTEYAIVGLQDGVSFVSLADPDNAVEVAKISGDNSNWRDMKTFGEYAYSVADQGDEGISAFDLRFLPDSVPFKKTQYEIPGFGPTFIQAHNLYIDTERGRLYTAGGSRQINDGGILIFDLNDDPLTPAYVGRGPETYSHDVYVVADTLYCSEIYDGELALYDISDLDNVRTLGTTLTPFTFTHNAWTTDDQQFIFTTDERGDAPVGAYDISDKDNIRQTFEFRPLGSINTGTIPHNVHVIDDYLSISYYTDGLVVADASKPDNIIEVANYDTWLGNNGGFNGAWGAYPFLPSGLTLVSDRSTGLYVIDVDYKRAARLEGLITDLDTGNPINNVSVSLDAVQPNGVATDATGEYKTGVADGGSYQVTFTANNYLPLTVTVDMVNGACLRLDTTLTSSTRRFNVDVTVVDDETDEVIPNASFVFKSETEDFSALTNDEGRVQIEGVFDGDYDLFVAEWGYQTVGEFTISPETLVGRTIRLSPGYMDDFVTDEGWTVSGDASTGEWERAVPIGTTFGPQPMNPDNDAPGDLGRECYVTGNGGGGAGTDDVDGGVTRLTSPVFGPLNLRDLRVSYQYWFANAGGDPPLNDALDIFITNGTQTELVARYDDVSDARWIADSFVVADFVEVNNNLQLIVETSDLPPAGHLVEAGFDNFLVYGEAIPSGTDNHFTEDLTARVFPNPSAADFTLSFAGRAVDAPRVRVTDAAGKVVAERAFTGSTVVFGATLPAGFYTAQLFDGAQRLYTTKLVKH